MDYFSSLPSKSTQNYNTVRSLFEKYFERKDPPSTARTELFHVVQRDDEPLEKYMLRIQKLANDAFPPGSAADMRNYVAVDRFLAGLKEKAVALMVITQHPSTLEQAYRLVRTAWHDRQAILGKKASARQVSFVEEFEEIAVSPSVRSVSGQRFQGNSRSNSTYVPHTSNEAKRSNVAEDISSLRKEIKSFKEEVLSLFSSLNSKGTSERSKSPPRTCFNCGREGHFRQECRSPRRSPSFSDQSRDSSPVDQNPKPRQPLNHYHSKENSSVNLNSDRRQRNSSSPRPD
jgi:hypothetical protein